MIRLLMQVVRIFAVEFARDMARVLDDRYSRAKHKVKGASVKNVILAALMSLPALAHAEQLDLGGVTSLIASAASQARGGTAANLDGRVEGILYLPLRSLHAGGDPLTEYAHVGGGASVFRTGSATKGEPLVLGMVNVTSVTSRLTSNWGWYQGHVSETSLPAIFAGVIVKLPLPGVLWTWPRATELGVSIGFGKPK